MHTLAVSFTFSLVVSALSLAFPMDNHITSMPNDIIKTVNSFLTIPDAESLRSTNKEFRRTHALKPADLFGEGSPNPTDNDFESFRLASAKGWGLTITRLLHDPRMSDADIDRIFHWSSGFEDNTERPYVLRRVLENYDAFASRSDIPFRTWVFTAFLFEQYEITERLIHPLTVEQLDDLFDWTTQEGPENFLKVLLDDGRVTLERENGMGSVISEACERGRTEFLGWLLDDGRSDPAENSNYCLMISSQRGYIDNVHYLLNDPRVDPDVAQLDEIINAVDPNLIEPPSGLSVSRINHEEVLNVLNQRKRSREARDHMDVPRDD